MCDKKNVVKDEDLEKVTGGTLLQNEGTILVGGANTQYIPTITVTDGNVSGYYDSRYTNSDSDNKKKSI